MCTRGEYSRLALPYSVNISDSCATTGEGLFEGLQWLSQNVKKRQP